jgi:pyrroline-5-carboxylate reductase
MSLGQAPLPDHKVALPQSLVLFGAGKMGASMLEGWLKAGLLPHSVTVLDPHPSAAVKQLCALHGITLNDTTRIGPPDVLVLAVKPQMLEGAAQKANAFIASHTLVLSILAGKRVEDLALRLPRVKGIVRAMPNLPASIGRGATGAFASPETSDAQRAFAQALLDAVGIVVWLAQESLMDSVTALSGSGPAYVFYLVEALSTAGQTLGLSPAISAQLARETVIGAAELLRQSDAEASELRQAVTSPGGTTAAALEILMGEEGLALLMQKAMKAARRRAEDLSG